jgi:type II secretory pathway component PulC
MAFLREGPVGPQHFYRVGETLPGGGVLREVYRTRILFAREGRLEELTFPQHPLRVGAQPSMSALPSMVYVDSSSGNAAEALSGNQLPDDSPNGVARVETEQPSVIRRR